METREQVNDEREKNQKLAAQVNRNFKNSSTPSSLDPFRRKVTNNRDKTGRGKGGQPGHEGHKRKPLPVTEEQVYIPAPAVVADNPDYYIQGNGEAAVRKQVIGLRLEVTVTEYYAHIYRNRKTGARYHAPFPEGVQLDVNYDESVKAAVFLLTPSRYYRKGYNLARELREYKESVLRFLTNPAVDFGQSGNESRKETACSHFLRKND